ncbi:MAG: zinc-binding dehydrogenase [Actinomycetota bacterium]|nr:zinc-binding dehydrogenase [Actinomycetota bacterium]
MRAIVSPGGQFAFAEVSEPVRANPEEVLIEVEYVSLNRGEFSATWQPDAVIGWDASGTVIETSSDGLGPVRGSRVVSWGLSGGWAQRRVVDRRNLAILPADIESAMAAAIPVAGLTALHAVRQLGAPPGANIAVTGATGGVGHLIVQLAARAGFRVAALTRSPERAAPLERLGDPLTRVVDVRDIGKLRTVEAVIDTTGGPVLEQLVSLVAPEGKVVLVGAAAGSPALFETASLIASRIDLVSVRNSTPVGAELKYLVDLVANGQLHVAVHNAESWDGLVNRPMPDTSVFGKAVYRVDSSA